MTVIIKQKGTVLATYHHDVPEHWKKAWKRLGYKVIEKQDG